MFSAAVGEKYTCSKAHAFTWLMLQQQQRVVSAQSQLNYYRFVRLSSRISHTRDRVCACSINEKTWKQSLLLREQIDSSQLHGPRQQSIHSTPKANTESIRNNIGVHTRHKCVSIEAARWKSNFFSINTAHNTHGWIRPEKFRIFSAAHCLGIWFWHVYYINRFSYRHFGLRGTVIKLWSFISFKHERCCCDFLYATSRRRQNIHNLFFCLIFSTCTEADGNISITVFIDLSSSTYRFVLIIRLRLNRLASKATSITFILLVSLPYFRLASNS